MIDKITHEKAVNDVKDGMSYLQAAKKYGVDDFTVERWCRDVNVRSFHASRRKIVSLLLMDKKILDAVMLHKVVTCRGLAEVLGCSGTAANRHLQNMVMNEKIQSFRIPPLSSAAGSRRGLFTKFINTKIYYVSKDDLAMWIRSKLPEEVPSSLRGYVTHIFRSLDVNIFGV